MATVTEKEIREKADDWGRLQLMMAPLAVEAAALEREIKTWLKTSGRKLTITGEVAIAKRFDEEKFGPREISVAAFVAAAADSDQEDREACLKVEIKKAEALLGKETIDRISNRPTITKTVEVLELKCL